ncbi:MAG: 30S ribosomal protein S17 [Planctomycetota bacterium]|nr:30S ribosomal protein S17 [Planctomycetota bacterium]
MAEKQEQSETPHRQRLTGTVSSVGGEKTIRVVVDKLVKHPLYGKYVRRRSKLAVHDPADTAKLGDKVEIVSCRPISKTKSWRLLRVIRPAAGSAVSGSVGKG